MEPGSIALIVGFGAGPATALITWALGRHRDRSELKSQILFQRYQLQVRLFEELEKRAPEAYHGSLELGACETRRIETLGFRAQVLFAFGEEDLANEVMGVIFTFQDAHRRREGQAGFGNADPQGAADLSRNATERLSVCSVKMLRSIQSFERRMGIPATRIEPRTKKLLDQVAAAETASRAQIESAKREALPSSGTQPRLPPKDS